jgi:hypothetical protein
MIKTPHFFAVVKMKGSSQPLIMRAKTLKGLQRSVREFNQSETGKRWPINRVLTVFHANGLELYFNDVVDLRKTRTYGKIKRSQSA